jgi:putative alpha-1,2-mannosidase
MALNRTKDAEKYMNRSTNWQNVWNPRMRDLYTDDEGEIRATKFQGFPQPRYMNGTWKYQNTRTCSPIQGQHSCYFDTALATYEGSPWLYSFYVPQDMGGLVKTMGGKEAFVERLMYFHESGIAYMGNEQQFLPVFQFHYGARPGLSSYWVHRYIPSIFNATVNGIPGNDDCAMGAFSALAMMGIFPVAGQDVYLLTPPLFPEVRLKSRGPKPAIIRKVVAPGTPGNASDAIYIQSAKLDGRPYTRNWITHELFLKGGLLEITVGRNESSWGTRDEDLPPSWPVAVAGTGKKGFLDQGDDPDEI